MKFLYIAIAVVGLALIVFYGKDNHLTEDLFNSTYSVQKIITTDGIQKPASLLRFKGNFVSAELQKNRLAFFNSLQGFQTEYFDPKEIGKSFASPHYMSLSPWGTLLVTNGWGNSIVEITDLHGRGWRKFSGVGKKFNAPHGICVDKDGWIYVGDSLNSRLVRFKDLDGKDYQVFADNNKLIAYSRQLVCDVRGVWVSNSYEPRPGLNKGQGGNVLLIDDFNSGEAEILFQSMDSNITGILPDSRGLLVGRWGPFQNIVYAPFDGQPPEVVAGSSGAQNGLGVPYSFYKSKEGAILATYFGDFQDNNGGYAILKK